MVWACGKNGRVPHDQKGVDGGSKWRASATETKVRLEGRCDGGLGNGVKTVEAPRQLAKDRKESPCTHVTERVSCGHFCLDLCSFGPPSRALVVITWRGVRCYMMRLESTVKRAQLLKIKAQMSSMWAKSVCVI